MALAPLATSADYTARYGAPTDTGRVDQLLADVSGQVRATAGHQQISLVTDDVVTLRGSGSGTLRLPQRPVVAVAAINGLTSSAWRWDDLEVLTRLDGLMWDGAVTVTYTHGYDPVPDWIVGICCAAVKRALDNPTGLRSDSIDDYSRTFAAEGNPGQVLLTQGEVDAIARAFGTNLGTVALR